MRREKKDYIYVFVLNADNKPLMPCSPKVARLLTESKEARVVRREPATIKLVKQIENPVLQEVVVGVDAGSKVVGVAATTNGKVVYQAEVTVRQDVSPKMTQRKMYRVNRRFQKTRYRHPRWLNRSNSRKVGRLAPSTNSKVNSHLREIVFIKSILPITRTVVEVAPFDTHKISNPEVIKYRDGNQKGFYNVKAYVLYRDGYKCQRCKTEKKGTKFQVHHIVFRSKGGTDEPKNLITLCSNCHDKLHKGKFDIKGKKSATKHATEVSVVSSQLRKQIPDEFKETYGYETKFKREQILKLPKSHANDAIAICCNEGEIVEPNAMTFLKRHVAGGDYKQTKGSRSEQKLPTGKVVGFRKFDEVLYRGTKYFVKGRMSKGGYALLSDVMGVIQKFANPKTIKLSSCKRLSARKTTLISSVSPS